MNKLILGPWSPLKWRYDKRGFWELSLPGVPYTVVVQRFTSGFYMDGGLVAKSRIMLSATTFEEAKAEAVSLQLEALAKLDKLLQDMHREQSVATTRLYDFEEMS